MQSEYAFNDDVSCLESKRNMGIKVQCCYCVFDNVWNLDITVELRYITYPLCFKKKI